MVPIGVIAIDNGQWIELMVDQETLEFIMPNDMDDNSSTLVNNRG